MASTRHHLATKAMAGTAAIVGLALLFVGISYWAKRARVVDVDEVPRTMAETRSLTDARELRAAASEEGERRGLPESKRPVAIGEQSEHSKAVPRQGEPQKFGLSYPSRLPYDAHEAKQKVYERHLVEYEYVLNYIASTGVTTNQQLRHLGELSAMIEMASSNKYFEFKPMNEKRSAPKNTADVKYQATEMLGMWIIFEIKKSDYPDAFLAKDFSEERTEAKLRELEERRRARRTVK